MHVMYMIQPPTARVRSCAMCLKKSDNEFFVALLTTITGEMAGYDMDLESGGDRVWVRSKRLLTSCRCYQQWTNSKKTTTQELRAAD